MNDTNKSLKTAIAILGLVVTILVVALIYSGRQAAEQIERDHTTNTSLSNQVVKTVAELEDHQQVITNLVNDLTARAADIVSLSNSLATIMINLDQTQTSLKGAQDELVKRDETITKLEANNQALETHTTELKAINVNLNNQITELTSKLTAAEGDKAALTTELKHLQAEKAELEHDFNDLNTLRAQVKKIKRDMNVAVRLERAQTGLPAEIEIKGAQKLLQNLNPTPPRPKHYDLNVEVDSEGSVEIIPPLKRDSHR